MRLIINRSVFFIMILCCTLLLSSVNALPQAVEFRMIFNDTSLVILVEENNQNEADRVVSLHDLGFIFEYYGELVHAKLADFGALELDISWAQPGICIEIEVPGNEIPLSRLCQRNAITVTVPNVDRFWFDANTGEFRPFTFSNFFTDQPCIISNAECVIRFEQNAEEVNHGSIGQTTNDLDEMLVAEIPFGDDVEDQFLMMELIGDIAIIQQSDCETTSLPILPDDEIVIFALCDASASFARFYVYNPLDIGGEVEWVVWRVQSSIPSVDPLVETSSPVTTINSDTITGIVNVAQLNLRSGPGTEYPPDTRIPFVYEGTALILTGYYIDVETRHLWYRAEINGRVVWVFANNVTINEGNLAALQAVTFAEIPQRPQLPDIIEDACPNDPNANRRSECPNETQGIATNPRVSNPPPIDLTNIPTRIPPISVSVTVTVTATEPPNTPTSPQNCTLTVSASQGVNVRRYPDYGGIVGGLANGTSLVITRQMINTPSGTWYHVGSGWVVGSGVTLTGNCGGLLSENYATPTPIPPPPPTNTPVIITDDTSPPPQCNSVSISGASSSNGWQYTVTGTANCRPSVRLRDWVNPPNTFDISSDVSFSNGNWSVTVYLGTSATEPPADCGKAFTVIATVGESSSNRGITKTSC